MGRAPGMETQRHLLHLQVLPELWFSRAKIFQKSLRVKGGAAPECRNGVLEQRRINWDGRFGKKKAKKKGEKLDNGNQMRFPASGKR